MLIPPLIVQSITLIWTLRGHINFFRYLGRHLFPIYSATRRGQKERDVILREIDMGLDDPDRQVALHV